MLILLGAGGVILLRAWCRRPDERPRVLGLGAYLAAYVCVAVAIGWGRGGGGPRMGLQSRYMSLSIPALCTLYFIPLLYSSRRQSVQQGLLFLLALVMFGVAIPGSLAVAEPLRERRIEFESDLRDGLPRALLAERYYGGPLGLYPEGSKSFAEYLGMLRDAKIGMFAGLQEDPDFHEVPLTAANSSFDPLNGVYTLRVPQRVYALRVSYHLNGPPAQLQLLWRERDVTDYSETGRTQSVGLFSRRTDTTVLKVQDRLDQFRLRSDAPPGTLQTGRIDLFVLTGAPIDEGRGGGL
jgi:hypothetical protein